MSNYAFTKTDRLRKRTEYLHVSQHGKKVQNLHFLAYYSPNNENASRLGITVTKRIGNAVTRNRIKRLVREDFRLNHKEVQPYLDINVIAKKNAVAETSATIFHSLGDLFEKIKRDCRH